VREAVAEFRVRGGVHYDQPDECKEHAAHGMEGSLVEMVGGVDEDEESECSAVEEVSINFRRYVWLLGRDERDESTYTTKGETLIKFALSPEYPMPLTTSGKKVPKALTGSVAKILKTTVTSFFQSVITSLMSLMLIMRVSLIGFPSASTSKFFITSMSILWMACALSVALRTAMQFGQCQAFDRVGLMGRAYTKQRFVSMGERRM